MRFRLIFVMMFVFALGCAENLDPKDPEGAYNLYVKALWAKDAKGVWKRAAPSTHDYFQQQYETLVDMDETISRYLPPTDHKIAREQAGSILTSKVKNGEGLFLEVFKPSQLKLEEKHAVGASVETIKINEDETAAELKTLGGDTFYLMKGDAEEWFIMLVRSSTAVEKQMGWLGSNESALKQTIEDLIAEERKEREAVIAELMKLEPPKKENDEAPAEDAAPGDEAPNEDGADGGQEENP